jgi:hypothetical protein
MKVEEQKKAETAASTSKDGKEAGKEPVKEVKDADTLTFEGRRTFPVSFWIKLPEFNS